MSTANLIDPDVSHELSMKAGSAFHPRSPISDRELFAGRWEQLTTVVDAVSQTGLHIVIFGERGVGKTSLANVIDPLLYVMEKPNGGKPSEKRLVVKVNTNHGDKFSDVWVRAFDEVVWYEDRPMMGFTPTSKITMSNERTSLRSRFGISDSPSIDDVRRTLGILKRSVFIFDEFDRGDQALRRSFTDLLKALSDYSVESTVVLVGVSDTVDGLLQDHASIVRAIIQVQLPRMKEKELKDILQKASTNLGIEFTEDAIQLIINTSQGLPHYTHLIGLHATRQAIKRLSRQVAKNDVYDSFNQSVKQAIQSITDKYLKAIHTAHKDALYDKVLLACAVTSTNAKDALGYFHPSDVVSPLASILNRDNVTIATFQRHINEFTEKERGAVLERSGGPRAFKFRFSDPLLPPFVIMTFLSSDAPDRDRLRPIVTPT